MHLHTLRTLKDLIVPPQTSTQLRALAMMACFVVSGLVHELMFWYCQGSVTGLWLAFFSLQVSWKPRILKVVDAPSRLKHRCWFSWHTRFLLCDCIGDGCVMCVQLRRQDLKSPLCWDMR